VTASRRGRRVDRRRSIDLKAKIIAILPVGGDL
jgi:hypothetical protein